MADYITVMLVDDEKLTLEDLSTIIDWESCGYRIVATAFNGKQALRKYRELHPQLILTDIRMPFMDGIEMISEIRKSDQKVSIVLLTAYEEFEYAKAAIRLGITEYLIKSEITADSMRELLNRLSQTIIQENRREKILTDRMLEQFFLSNRLSESQDADSFLNRKFYLLLVEQDLPVNVSGETFSAGLVIPRVKLVDLLSREVYEGWNLEAITSLSGGQIVLALSCQKNIHEKEYQALYRCAKELRQKLTDTTSFSFTVYVFGNKASLYSLKRYCDENKTVFLKKYFEGSGRVQRLSYPLVQEQHGYQRQKRQITADDMLNLHSSREIQEYFAEVLQVMRDVGNLEYMTTLCRELYYVLYNACRKAPEYGSYEDISLERSWASWLDAEKICAWFAKQTERLENGRQNSQNRYSRPVVDAVNYIRRNYRNPNLSLNDIADHVHLSVGYLSGEFKKEVGVTLKNYITDIRIDEAKRMMEKGNYKIYEICSEVGYHSSQYFSQAFYKKVGMFPTEYKRKE